MNIALLKEVQATITRVPQQFDMGIWHGSVNHGLDRNAPNPVDDCNTVACIAGWAVAISECDLSLQIPFNTMARNALDLSDRLAIELFFSTNWDDPFRSMHRAIYSSPNKNKESEVASAYIDHFIQKHATPKDWEKYNAHLAEEAKKVAQSVQESEYAHS